MDRRLEGGRCHGCGQEIEGYAWQPPENARMWVGDDTVRAYCSRDCFVRACEDKAQAHERAARQLRRAIEIAESGAEDA